MHGIGLPCFELLRLYMYNMFTRTKVMSLFNLLDVYLMSCVHCVSVFSNERWMLSAIGSHMCPLPSRGKTYCLTFAQSNLHPVQARTSRERSIECASSWRGHKPLPLQPFGTLALSQLVAVFPCRLSFANCRHCPLTILLHVPRPLQALYSFVGSLSQLAHAYRMLVCS